MSEYLKDQIYDYLEESGVKTTREITEHFYPGEYNECNKGRVMQALSRLKKWGRIERNDDGKPGRPAHWRAVR